MYPTRTRHAAPISMTPHKGPFEPFFSNPDDETMLREHELIVVIILKTFCAFEWVSVLAQFVRVYNNLNPDTQAFSAGWDALNRFVSYFRIDHTSAAELRRYYVERAEEARAMSRKRVVNDFSPYLREKFVWMLNKEWLVDVPCFSFVVERLKQRPESGMERFLVEIALAMHPAEQFKKKLEAIGGRSAWDICGQLPFEENWPSRRANQIRMKRSSLTSSMVKPARSSSRVTFMLRYDCKKGSIGTVVSCSVVKEVGF